MKKVNEPSLLTMVVFIIFNILGIMAGLLMGVEMGWIIFVDK